jgi:hypothetical protein
MRTVRDRRCITPGAVALTPRQSPTSADPSLPALGIVLAVAVLLRVAVATTLPNTIWADEIFQTVEPAHRLLTGQGLMSWEWVVGIRSWLVPGLFVPVLWLADALHLPPGGAPAMVAGP